MLTGSLAVGLLTAAWYFHRPVYSPAVEPLRQPPIAFAHRGARAHAPDNTIASFQLALRLGATGLHSEVRLTADKVAVLYHQGRVRSGLRRSSVAQLRRSDLPEDVASLDELYAVCGTSYELSLDVADVAAVSVVLEVANAVGDDAVERLWLCHPDWETLATWRDATDGAKLVDSTRLRLLRQGPERRAAQLADAGIDAVNLHATDWSGGMTTLFHRFGRLALAWDAQHERVLRGLLRMGIDGVCSDHVDRMVDALQGVTGGAGSGGATPG